MPSRAISLNIALPTILILSTASTYSRSRGPKQDRSARQLHRVTALSGLGRGAARARVCSTAISRCRKSAAARRVEYINSGRRSQELSGPPLLRTQFRLRRKDETVQFRQERLPSRVIPLGSGRYRRYINSPRRAPTMLPQRNSLTK